MKFLERLKGKDRIETAENYSIVSIFVGAGIFSAGIGLSILNPQGASALLAMLGSVVSFVSIAILIFIWLWKEFKE